MIPQPRPGGLEGDLATLSVVEILQTLSLGGKTARVALRSDSRHGEMWFVDGAMTHAVVGPLYGDLAVYAMVEWKSGRFLVEHGSRSDARSVTQDVTYLVLEGLRRYDERTSGNASEADCAEVPPVLKADVRGGHARRRALGVLATTALVGAALTLILGSWRSPAASESAAAVPAPEAPVVREAPVAPPPVKRPRPPRPAVKAPAVVAALLAPEVPVPPAPEEPLPVEALAAPPLAPEEPEEPAEPVVAAAETARLVISGKSGADGGSLTVLVDGAPAYTHDRLGKDEPFEAEIGLTPGEHVIVARLEDGAKGGTHEDSAHSVFAEGETRSLRIRANRTLGSPIKLKLERGGADR